MKKDIQEEFCRVSGIDWQVTLDRFMNNESLYEKFLIKFPADPLFNELKNSMEAGDEHTSFRIAHTLKGVAGNLGLDNLFKAVSLLTDELRNGHIEKATVLMDDVSTQYEAVCNLIERIR